jgi:hypothetical protein
MPPAMQPSFAGKHELECNRVQHTLERHDSLPFLLAIQAGVAQRSLGWRLYPLHLLGNAASSAGPNDSGFREKRETPDWSRPCPGIWRVKRRSETIDPLCQEPFS